jgi:hypothetical protein
VSCLGSAINVWLWAHSHSPVTLINFYNNQAGASQFGTDPISMKGLIAMAPPGCDRIFMWFERDGYISHYKCIRRHAATGLWFELDSMDTGITHVAPPMLDEDWANLVSDFYFAAAIDDNAYNGCSDLGWCPPSEKIFVEDKTTLPLVKWEDVRISPHPLKPS